MSIEIEDMLDTLESNEKPFVNNQQQQKNNYGGRGNQPQKPTLWDKTDFKHTKIDATTFDKSELRYAMILVKGEKEIPETVLEKAKSLAVLLNSKGFIYRHGSDGNDKFQTALVKIPDFKYESYLPWKKFNPMVDATGKLSEKAYNLAFSYYKNYNERTATVRAILAKDVQVMLGEDCRKPLTMFIAYTECGTDKMKKDMDFKKIGPVFFYIKICAEANIPVFNIGNEESFKQLVEFIKFKISQQQK